ncbi:Conserved oligomeric Golgi complex subunit [Entomophthora muscae]|uniref:Conserved oligomeric Golgi complex subunit n=1 Tax=Entomophthora muscae TaxID=34485 RepID=A0ACC2SUQ4_9FUNG|nr:Conserved oligomeric Golgi complex subunit [Entomophthora muscae]
MAAALPKVTEASPAPLGMDVKDFEKTKIGFEISDKQEQLFQLEKEISKKAAENPEKILKHVSDALKNEELFTVVKKDLSSLEDCLERLKSRIQTPRQIMEAEIHKLERLQELSSILRDLIRFSQLVRQLTLVSQENEQASLLIQKIDHHLKNSSLESIKIVEALIGYINHRKLRAFNKAKENISEGLVLKNPLLLTRGLSSLEHIDLISRAIHDFGPSQTSKLKAFIRSQCQNENTLSTGQAHVSFNNKEVELGYNSKVSAKPFWLGWLERLT